jgi:hypothetical protein
MVQWGLFSRRAIGDTTDSAAAIAVSNSAAPLNRCLKLRFIVGFGRAIECLRHAILLRCTALEQGRLAAVDLATDFRAAVARETRALPSIWARLRTAAAAPPWRNLRTVHCRNEAIL